MRQKVTEIYFDQGSAYPSFILEDGTVVEPAMSDAGVWWKRVIEEETDTKE